MVLACLDCGRLSHTSRCPEHTRARQRATEARRHRPSSWARGYDTTYRRNRAAILADSPPCWVDYCTTAATTVDHVIPISLGGSNSMENLRPSCTRHNASRGNRLDWEA